MAAPVLTLSEQKKALSGKIKKKKVIKNILGLPNNVKVECPVIDNKDAEKLATILSSLLPSARIPNLHTGKNEEKEHTQEMEDAIKQAKEKRKELSLGVNDLNRSVKKNLISAAIFAADISPKFLIHHLNLLCIHNKVPFLHMPGLRKITQLSLGFPCIALGFRKNVDYFMEAIRQIRTIAEKNNTETVSNKNIKNISSESDEEESIENLNKNLVKSDDNIPFQLLYRNLTKERIFIPENENNCMPVRKQETDFIPLNVDTNEDEKNYSVLQGISCNLAQKRKNKVTQLEIINLEQNTSISEEEYILPKKKRKKSWVIDTAGLKQNFKYSPANIVKIHSNPDRKKKNNKYLLK